MSGYKRFGIPESFERGERGSVIRKSGEGIQNYFVGSVNQGTGVLGTYSLFQYTCPGWVFSLQQYPLETSELTGEVLRGLVVTQWCSGAETEVDR